MLLSKPGDMTTEESVLTYQLQLQPYLQRLFNKENSNNGSIKRQ